LATEVALSRTAGTAYGNFLRLGLVHGKEIRIRMFVIRALIQMGAE
jgi:hypothetical protein